MPVCPRKPQLESAAWKIHITNRKFKRNIGPDNKNDI
jgi:hypothetical protein